MKMKKFFSTLLGVMALAILLSCGMGKDAYAKSPITTMKANQAVYMRQGPGPSYGVVTTIPGGAEVDVYDAGSDWFEVEYKGNHGYTYCSFLSQKTNITKSDSSSSSSSSSSTSPIKPGICYFGEKKMYATTGVYVRSGPGTNYKVVGSLNAGDAALVSGSGNNFYAILWKGGEAYVCCDYLSSTAPGGSSSSSSSSSASASKPASTGVTGEKYITSTGLRMRATPSNDGKIVTLIPAGATVGVTSKGHGDDGWWFEVNYNGYTGYSYAYYLYK